MDAVGGAPAFVTFVDLHTGVATPRALALAGVDGPRTFDENAEIVCVDGRPTGELRETAACALVQSAMPSLSAAERYRLYAATMRRFAEVGLTGLHAMDGTLETFDLLRELEANGDLCVRVVVPFWIRPDHTPADWDELVAQRHRAGRLFRGGVAKFFIDGVIDAGTGWLFEPDTLGEGTLPFWPDPDALPPRRRALRGRRLPVCDARDRRPCRARDARRLPQRGRRPGRPPPHRAHRDGPPRRPPFGSRPKGSSPRCRPST